MRLFITKVSNNTFNSKKYHFTRPGSERILTPADNKHSPGKTQGDGASFGAPFYLDYVTSTSALVNPPHSPACR